LTAWLSSFPAPRAIELRNLTAGIKGEQEAAFHLDGHYKDGQNNGLLHDLRKPFTSHSQAWLDSLATRPGSHSVGQLPKNRLGSGARSRTQTPWSTRWSNC
jgi:hypothetical protein